MSGFPFLSFLTFFPLSVDMGLALHKAQSQVRYWYQLCYRKSELTEIGSEQANIHHSSMYMLLMTYTS